MDVSISSGLLTTPYISLGSSSLLLRVISQRLVSVGRDEHLALLVCSNASQ